jgi:fatty acid desaturase
MAQLQDQVQALPPYDEIRELKRRILSALPADALEHRPHRAFLMLPLVGIIVLGSVVSVRLPLTAWSQLLISIVIGGAYGSLFFLGHEMAHGAVVRRGWLRTALLHVCFLVFGLSPHLWEIWHVRVHHSFTNMPKLDPDHYGDIADVRDIPLSGLMTRLAPGSGHPLCALFLFVWFTMFSQAIFWSTSRKLKGFEKLRRPLVKATMISMVAFWLGVGMMIGPRDSLFVIIIPMLIANFSVIAYIITNHQLRPLTDTGDQLDGSMSVTSWLPFDLLFHHFSHHIEHHLFPSMSTVHAPAVRTLLRCFAPDRYLAPPHWRALLLIYSTPRAHKDNHTLINILNGREVSLRAVHEKLVEMEKEVRSRG